MSTTAASPVDGAPDYEELRTAVSKCLRYDPDPHYLQRVEELLQAGADPNGAERSTSIHLLQTAVDNIALVKLLLDYGAEVNKKNDSGYSALNWAASRGREDVVRLLLDNGADPDSRNDKGATIAEDVGGRGGEGRETIIALLQEASRQRAAQVEEKKRAEQSVQGHTIAQVRQQGLRELAHQRRLRIPGLK